MPYPNSNPYTFAKWELGRLLYFDARLSQDGTISCASCHSPERGMADHVAISPGVGGALGDRCAPTVWNSGYVAPLMWDGRFTTLEEQALGPIVAPPEMNNTLANVVATLASIAGYVKRFEAVFGPGALSTTNVEDSARNLAKAIATFERTQMSGNSKVDQFIAGNASALSGAARRGLDLFQDKAKCSKCHGGPNFDEHGDKDAFHNIGIGYDTARHSYADEGRKNHTKSDADLGKFKTPTLREITNTAPYMHDGSLKTLEEVIDHYDRGGPQGAPNLSPLMVPLHLTAAEKADLIEFMRALEGSQTPDTVPELP